MELKDTGCLFSRFTTSNQDSVLLAKGSVYRSMQQHRAQKCLQLIFHHVAKGKVFSPNGAATTGEPSARGKEHRPLVHAGYTE